MNTLKPHPHVLWLQVFTLAGLQAAITLTWLIYKIYLPQLLTQFGFPESLATTLLIIENALAVVMEPLFGLLSDRSQLWLGSRFPLISLGVILASSLFIAIPCIVTFIPPLAILRLILPLTLVAWALAMTVFRSPAIVLLGKYAIPANLPLASSFLTLTSGVIGAFKGIANQFILGFGAVFAFAIASCVLLTAGFALRFVHPPEIPTTLSKIKENIPIKKLLVIAGTGFSVAWGSSLLMDALGKILKSQFHTPNVTMLMLWIGLILAFTSLPAGFCAVKIGNRRAMLSGVGGVIWGMILLIFWQAQIPTLFIVIVSFSLILNGVIPLVLQFIPQCWAGLGIGVYFGTFSATISLLNLLFPQMSTMTSTGELIMATLAFFTVGGCTFSLSEIPSSPPREDQI